MSAILHSIYSVFNFVLAPCVAGCCLLHAVPVVSNGWYGLPDRRTINSFWCLVIHLFVLHLNTVSHFIDWFVLVV